MSFGRMLWSNCALTVVRLSKTLSPQALHGCRQANSSPSLLTVECVNICRKKLPPLAKSGSAVRLEIDPSVEMSFLFEIPMDGSLNGEKFMQTSHGPRARIRSFSPSKWQVRILGAIVEPASRFLFRSMADNFNHCAI
jgi:hypothetical protein